MMKQWQENGGRSEGPVRAGGGNPGGARRALRDPGRARPAGTAPGERRCRASRTFWPRPRPSWSRRIRRQLPGGSPRSCCELDLTAPAPAGGRPGGHRHRVRRRGPRRSGGADRPRSRRRDRRPYRPDLDCGLRRLRPGLRLHGGGEPGRWKCPRRSSPRTAVPPARWRWPATTRPCTRAGPPAAGS